MRCPRVESRVAPYMTRLRTFPLCCSCCSGSGRFGPLSLYLSAGGNLSHPNRDLRVPPPAHDGEADSARMWMTFGRLLSASHADHWLSCARRSRLESWIEQSWRFD